jgi:pectate lyase
MRAGTLSVFLLIAALSAARPAGAALRQVGPARTLKSPGQAAAVVQDGDVVEIDAGVYTGDYVSWDADNLTFRGVGAGRAHIRMDPAEPIPNEKGLWVVGGTNVTIENMEFSGATVPDENGAGIRAEANGLTIRHCYFHDNENGILGGAHNGTFLIEHSEFAHNGFGDGQSHNLYIDSGSKLIFQYNYSHHARIGHDLKTRAVENHILYNRITDETGTSSYEIDVPNGGLTFVIGNLVQQGPNNDNSTLLAYGEEGNPDGRSQALYVVNNTFVNEDAGGLFILKAGGVAGVVLNNIFAGSGTVYSGTGSVDMTKNWKTPDAALANRAGYDYRLTAGSTGAIDKGSDPGMVNGVNLMPVFQYVHPMQGEARPSAGAVDVGAYEFAGSGSGTVPARPRRLRVR